MSFLWRRGVRLLVLWPLTRVMFASGDDPGSVFDTLAGELAWNEKVNGVDVEEIV